ncbi:MAG TPA: hypothetical protein VGL59_02465 [Polyangia bacterium]|jgi:antitoxin (DNA-binding transcriptional repressor) of toxin-antitoxin stability system
MTKRYSVAHARRRMAEMLDSAERGEAVIIERKGVRFQLVATKNKAPRARAPVVEIVDPAVDRGDWTWAEGASGLTFVGRKRR